MRNEPVEVALEVAIPPPRRFLSLVALDEALERFRPHLIAVPPVRVALDAAVGHILAEPIRAEVPIPPIALAARDGYAVEADRVVGAGPSAPVLLTERPRAVTAGDPMPQGTDAILPPDAVQEVAGLVEVSDMAAAGSGVRRPGHDAHPGSVLVESGTRLTPLAIAAARMLGLRTVAVRRPHIQILGVGAEIPEAQDVGGRLVGALATAFGAEIDQPARLADDPDAIAEMIGRSAADLVLTIGGTGEGTNDRTVDAVGRIGEILAHGLAVTPGVSAAFALAGGTPILLLPGRIEDTLAAFLLAGRPVIERLAGAAPATPLGSLPLAAKVISTIGMTEIQFVAIENGTLRPLGGAGLPVGRLARADGYVVVPPGLEGWPEGTFVPFWPLPTAGACA